MNIPYQHIVKKFWDRPLIASAVLFAVIFAILTTIYVVSDGDPIPDDHYFHFKYAYLLRTQGLDAIENFDWIYLSGLANSDSRYAANLYQVSLIPFTYMSDWLFALHMADAFYASIVLALFYFIMRREKMRHPLFFTLLLFGSTFVMERLMLGRAFVLMVALVYLAMYFAIHRKYIALMVIAVIHVLWHQSTYFLPLIIVGIVEMCRIATEKKIFTYNILATIVGTVVAMAFFPGFPQSIIGWFTWILAIMNNGADRASGSLGGTELAVQELTMSTLTQGLAGVAVLFCVVVTIYIFYLYKKKDEQVIGVVPVAWMHWLCVLTVFLLSVIIGSVGFTGRLDDFIIPSLVLLMSFIVTILNETRLVPPRTFGGHGFTATMWSIVLVLCAYSVMAIYQTANSFDYRPAQEAAEWIDAHSEDGAKVYLHNWSYFNMMFFTNSNNIYSMGIEPLTLKAYDESLYWKYFNIFALRYYCELQEPCDRNMYEELMIKRTDMESKNAFKKENSEKIIRSITEDFDAHIVLSNSRKLNDVIAMSPEHIVDRFDVHSDKYIGETMVFTVFILK